MIDNFSIIDKFLQFEEGCFYKFELLVRNTDGYNSLFQEGISNTNKNILIKSWYIDTWEYYDKIKYEMITLANITGARLYVTLDRKDNVKLVQSLIHSYTDSLVAITNKQKLSIKKLAKAFASETSKVENSCKTSKTIMFDIDTKDEDIRKEICAYITEKNQLPHILVTRKGYHIFCYKKFDHSDWLDRIVDTHFKNTEFESNIAEKDFRTSYKYKVNELVSVKPNELGLVYHPMKMEETFHDKLYNLVEPYLDGDFVGYNEEEQAFDIVQAVKEILEYE